jgi:hypothetical protein
MVAIVTTNKDFQQAIHQDKARYYLYNQIEGIFLLSSIGDCHFSWYLLSQGTTTGAFKSSHYRWGIKKWGIILGTICG